MNSPSGVYFMRISKDKLLELVNEVILEIAAGTAPPNPVPNPEADRAAKDVSNELNAAEAAIQKALDAMGDYPTEKQKALDDMLNNLKQLAGETMVAEVQPNPSPLSSDDKYDDLAEVQPNPSPLSSDEDDGGPSEGPPDKKSTLYGENEELEEEIELNEEELQELIMNELEALYE